MTLDMEVLLDLKAYVVDICVSRRSRGLREMGITTAQKAHVKETEGLQKNN
jgi:hypothetical protein